MRYPPSCDTPEKRLRFCSRVQERWRLWHNAEADTLFPSRGLDDRSYWGWWRNTANPRLRKIATEINRLRPLIGLDLSGTVTIDDAAFSCPRWDLRDELMRQGRGDSTYNGSIDLGDLNSG